MMRDDTFQNKNTGKQLWQRIALHSLKANIIPSALAAGWKGAAK